MYSIGQTQPVNTQLTASSKNSDPMTPGNLEDHGAAALHDMGRVSANDGPDLENLQLSFYIQMELLFG